jgi:hypothetical protein
MPLRALSDDLHHRSASVLLGFFAKSDRLGNRLITTFKAMGLFCYKTHLGFSSVLILQNWNGTKNVPLCGPHVKSRIQPQAIE